MRCVCVCVCVWVCVCMCVCVCVCVCRPPNHTWVKILGLPSDLLTLKIITPLHIWFKHTTQQISLHNRFRLEMLEFIWAKSKGNFICSSNLILLYYFRVLWKHVWLMKRKSPNLSLLIFSLIKVDSKFPEIFTIISILDSIYGYFSNLNLGYWWFVGTVLDIECSDSRFD